MLASVNCPNGHFGSDISVRRAAIERPLLRTADGWCRRMVFSNGSSRAEATSEFDGVGCLRFCVLEQIEPVLKIASIRGGR